MNQCKFEEKYFDFEKNHTDIFHCKENSEKEFCVLHDQNSQSKQKLEIFNKKLKIATESSEPLFLIGCHLPNIVINQKFSRPVYFTKSKIGSINCTNSNFKEVDFSGCHIEGQADFSKTIFLLSDFLKAIFNGNVIFKGAKFPNGVNFSGSSFNGLADFSDSKLVGPIFIGVEFQKIDFSLSEIESGEFLQTRIHKNANFIGSKIYKTTFEQSIFEMDVDFTGSEIKRSDFTNTQFESANFSESTLEINTYTKTRFKKIANFERSKFEKVEFIATVIEGNVNFTESGFQDVGFAKTKFLKKANFTKSYFNQKANFKFCEFATALFDEVKFETKAEFNFSKFFELASFKETVFEEVDFSNSEFSHRVLFFNTEFKEFTKFHNILFENPKHVLFDVKNLSNVSFLNTDISKIRFGENIKWGPKNDFTLIDYANIENKSESEIESVLAESRSLRENFERRFRDEDAQKILEHEIILEQKLKKNQINDPKVEVEKKLIELNRKYYDLKNEKELLEKKFKEKFSKES